MLRSSWIKYLRYNRILGECNHATTLRALALLVTFWFSPNAIFAQQPAQTSSSQPAVRPQQPRQQTPAKDPNDPIERIKDEGMNRSQVMQTLSYLS